MSSGRQRAWLSILHRVVALTAAISTSAAVAAQPPGLDEIKTRLNLWERTAAQSTRADGRTEQQAPSVRSHEVKRTPWVRSGEHLDWAGGIVLGHNPPAVVASQADEKVQQEVVGKTAPAAESNASEERSKLAEIERRVRAVYETVGPAIVRIARVNDEGHEWHFGSGVLVTADGHVVTKGDPYRPVPEGVALAFHLADGRRVTGSALGWSGEWRIGLAKIGEKGPWPHVTLGRAADVKVGQLCIEMAYALAPGDGFENQPALSLGCVTRSAVPIWLSSSCSLHRHGSGLFDLEGRLLGLTTIVPWKGDPTHTSVELIRTHWDELAAGRNLDRLRLLPSEKATGVPSNTEGRKPPTAEKDRAATAIEKARAATVRIRLTDDNRWSGVIVSGDGYIITCAHTDPLPGDKVTIFLPDGRDVAGKVLGTNRVSDVALVKITGKGPWPYVEMGDSIRMRPGTPCFRTGYPASHQGRRPLVHKGRVVDREDHAWSYPLLTSTSSTSPGESGGGIFDLRGRVVAVHIGAEGDDREVVRHGRVELFREQWDFLTAGRPVDEVSSQPLGEVGTAFRHLAGDSESIVVEVLGDNKERALGTIVGSDGRILTKASELEGALSCRLADGRVLKATVEKVSRQHDLAVLKIEATNLPAAEFSQSERTSPGALIAALSPAKSPVVGVVSRPVRPIAPERGWLGVSLGDGDSGLQVGDDSEARESGVPLRERDVIVQVEGHATPDLKTYQKVMEPNEGAALVYGGDPIRVNVKRGKKALEFRFPLPEQPYGHNHLMSDRCSAFPGVFDAHIPLTPRMCGGPVIDRTGRVIGVAIACRNQGWSYVIPAAVTRKIAERKGSATIPQSAAERR